MTNRNDSNPFEGYVPSRIRDPKDEPRYERTLIGGFMIITAVCMATHLVNSISYSMRNPKNYEPTVVQATQPSNYNPR